MADLFFREKTSLLITDVHVSSAKKAGTRMRIPISLPVSKICLFVGSNFIFQFEGVRTHAACPLASKIYLWTLSELSDLTTGATYVVFAFREMAVKCLLFLLWLWIIKQSPSFRFFKVLYWIAKLSLLKQVVVLLNSMVSCWIGVAVYDHYTCVGFFFSPRCPSVSFIFF